MRFHRGKIIKDINSIGRNLEHLIYLDCEPIYNYPSNYLKISPFKPPNIKGLSNHKD